MRSWLDGVRYRETGLDLYEIEITGYGPADVGPYDKLLKHVGRGSGLECHHIVEAEHLEMVGSAFTHATGPSVAIPWKLHRALISPRITGELNSYGGRRGGKVDLTIRELLELYRDVYSWHTPYRELYRIAENVLR